MKINNMKDLHEERRMLKMEILATEHLFLDSIRRSKHDAVSSIAGQILPSLSPASMMSGASSLLGQSSGKKAKWLKFLIPLIPVIMRMFNKNNWHTED